MMQTSLCVDALEGYRLCGHNGCRVWMIDDERPWCEVCELAMAPHVVARDGGWVKVEGESK